MACDIYPHLDKYKKNSGFVIWITGLSGSGKSTTAYAIHQSFSKSGIYSYVLDGDNLRYGINQDLGFTPEDRAENVRRTAEIAKLFAEAGLISIVSLISPLESDRSLARKIVGRERFFEVFIDTPLEVCEQRDPKGLYKKARLGQILNFTGISAPYQRPAAPDVIVGSENKNPSEVAGFILSKFFENAKNLHIGIGG